VIVLDLVPGQIEPCRTLVLRADAILPVIAGHIVASWPPDHRNLEFLYQFDKILAESILISQGRFWIINRAVDNSTDGLNKSTLDLRIHVPYFTVQINLNYAVLLCHEAAGYQTGKNYATEQDV